MRNIKQRQNKTIISLVTAIICLLMFSVAMTFAFFTASNNATSNTMQFGTLAVGVNGYTASNADLHTLVPGCTINLDGNIELAERENDAESGAITSNSTIGAFVRIKLTIEPATNGDTLPDTTSLMSAIVTAFGASWKTSGSDGYLYYAGKFMPVGTSNLGTNEVTSFDLSTVSFVVDREAFGNAWQDKAFVLKIEAEAIQAEHTGVTAAQITAGGQTLVNAISGVDAWSAISSANGGSSQEENNPLAQASLQYLDFEVVDEYGYPTWTELVSSENGGMSTLNEGKATRSNLMVDGAKFVGVGKNSSNKPIGDIAIPSYIKVVSGDVALATRAEWEENNAYKVICVADSAFYECDDLTSVTIPTTITKLGSSAFYGCSNLTSVTIPESITEIQNRAFAYCDNLSVVNFNATNCDTPMYDDIMPFEKTFDYDEEEYEGVPMTVNVGENVTILQSYLFYYSNTTVVNFLGNNPSLATIENFVFAHCPGLTSIIMPNNVTTLEWGAFDGCSGLTSITISSGLTDINVDMFYGCSGLTSIVVANGNSVYDSRGNSNAIIETSTNTLIFGCANTVIPNSVTSINSSAFIWCSGLTSIIIPSSVTDIGYSAFSDCSNLANVYYTGTEAQWNNITIDSYNEPLTNANITYNYAG